jgi:8-oxo-dGTP pyrophosphatase MutT (NUDIX family)
MIYNNNNINNINNVYNDKNGLENYNKQICRNCGAYGHLYKKCKKPIMSFGIICYRKISNKIEYLMVQRRDSLAFMEFIRGKYDLYNFEYIKHLMSFMTDKERSLLITKEFSELWNKVWYQDYNKPIKGTKEYYESEDKYMSLKEGVIDIDENGIMTVINITYLLSNINTKYNEPEWGFPKGRRRLREKDIDCSIREFCEETGFNKNDIEVDYCKVPYEEIFYGTNNVKYRHVYFIAKLINNIDKDIIIDKNNINQAREIGKAKWFSNKEVMKHIREHNVERKLLFETVDSDIINMKH